MSADADVLDDGAAAPGVRRAHPARIAAAVVGVIMVLLVALLATRDPATERKSTSNLIGQRAPGVAGEVLVGEPFDIGATDRWVVVNFFATWCAPCVTEHPELVAFSQAHAETGDAGRAIQDALLAKIRGAVADIVPGMGHDLPLQRCTV